VKVIKQTYHIDAPLSEVWQALVNPKYIDGWGGGSVKMNDKVGEKFSLWDGSIWGKNTEVIPEKKLVQEWYSDSDNRQWEKPSLVTFTLHQEKDTVRIELLHIDVPDADAESIKKGWQEYYLGPLKDYLEEKQKV